ncbi:MAG: hypothetical protein C3F07_14220 [Anaerolineales bacterium]|nr:succinylglutamate desuccinylase/aspartoacylase family protein [Anaerolineae bacterium]PWB71402.1 MAG: hypothetical protein C3F07_14220 [Anaerolineales bacterium]
MNNKEELLEIAAILVTAIAILLGACGTSPSAVATATGIPALSLTPALQLNPIPTATETMKELDLVILSDSSLLGVGKYYAAYIEEDLNATVNLHDEWQGSLSAKTLLKQLQKEERLRRILRDSEVVVYFGNPVGSATGDWSCVPRANYVKDCSPETFSEYQATLEAIVEEILALRDGAPTIIRATDFYVPVLTQWREAGLEVECTRCIENMVAAVHEAAAAQNIPVARVYDALNGPNHDVDPRDMGYIGADDIHTSDLGQQVIASLLRELGYEPVVP